MPRNIPKGFDPIAKRWRKMYKGERYEVYCSELNLPEDQWTELGSYQARNLWWDALKAEIDTKPAALRPDVQEVVDELRRKRDLLLAHNLDASEYDGAIREAIAASAKPIIDPKTKFDNLEDEVDAVCATPQPDGDGVNLLDPRTTARAALLMQHGVDLSGVDPMVLEIALGSKAYWNEKAATTTKVPDDRRIGALLDRWFQLKRKKLKVTTLARVQGHKKAFGLITHDETVVLSADMPVDVLTEEKIEEVFHAIDAEERDVATKDKKWVTFKSFLKYVVKKRLVPQPLNLDDKLLTFSVTTKEKTKPVMAEVCDFVAKLPDRLKLYALLAANCGMNNVDIGKLELRQIDLTAKTLTRKRLKTEAWDGVPTVTYRLWDETLQLLQKLMAKEGKLALLDAKSEPLYIEEKDGPDGKASLYDKIKSSWRDYFGRDEAKKYTIKDFRFISADIIKDSPQYRVYRSVWLGHSPKTVAEKSYSSSEDCSHVCDWLRTMYFPQA
jgi:integrase